jgi:GT2 family glycosyltransferase
VKLSCVVPATDEPGTLQRCLEAIRGASEAPEELICVTEPPGEGPATARNAGAAATDGELLVFVDADVVVHPDAFARIRSAFERDPGLAALFGAYDDEPEAAGAVSGFRNLLHHSVHNEGAGEAGTFWAGLGAVRRDAFAAVGGFDAERFREPSVEDIELGMRLDAAGHRIRLDPAVRGTHLKRWTIPEMLRVDLLRRGVPWTRLVLESGEPSSALNLGPRHRASMLASVAAAVALLARRPRLALLSVGALIALNARLYLLVWRRRGPRQAAAAVPLHLVHHLTAATAGGIGLAAHLAGAVRRGPARGGPPAGSRPPRRD